MDVTRIFIGSIRELSATILLFTARTKTISVTMFNLRESNDWGPIAVLSVSMLVITFVMIVLIKLEDAGRIFGANRLRTLYDITAPLVRNGVMATWMFIFIGSIRELSATILLFTARTKTISVTMFDLRESNDWGPIAVLSVSMLVITFVMIVLINRFTQRRMA